ncbi:C45 family autoproteolytic acyltransferase/hydolase [Halalkalicoccus subterraneus]|uniref:C45 family autoproteolytic acyltransferase/hydolase n=1 Tax=Halalkalicoccus subterraneus TaxID=2675002 RepID=UPI000EFCCA4D|nr:C45 family peptidase [Halalkalicoccus subterraneus]
MSQVKTGLRGLQLTGTPYERGVTHGTEFADEIATNVEIYLDIFEYKGTDEDTVYEQAEEFIPLIEEENEEYSEEMRGVAEGSGLSLKDITVLNARYEVMYSAFKQAADEVDEASPDACTAFAAQPEITADGHTYLGQNWDWMPGLETFVMDIRRDDKPNMVAMTEAGIVGGKIGVNEHGLGMTLNGLVTAKDGENPFRKPYHVRFREVLDAERMDSAIAPLITKDRACSGNVIVAHEEGEMVNLEIAPETANYLYPQDHLLTHANHVEDRSSMNSEFEKLIPDTLCRAPRLKRLLSKHAGEIDSDVLTESLQDHFGRPNSICRHPNEADPELDQLQTNGSYVMDLTERRLLGTAGPPCENEYKEFSAA